MKYLIRKFAIWLESLTRKWVIPSYVWEEMDKGNSSMQIEVSDAAVKYGICDPEVVRAGLLLRRVRYNSERNK